MLLSYQYPSPGIIPVLEEILTEPVKNNEAELCYPVITKLGKLSGNDVTDFFIRMLAHSDQKIVKEACVSLRQRRSPKALKALLEVGNTSDDPELVQHALLAAIASSPPNIEEFENYMVSFCHFRNSEQFFEWLISNSDDSYDIDSIEFSVNNSEILEHEKDAFIFKVNACVIIDTLAGDKLI